MLSPSVFESAFNSSPIGKYLLSPTLDAVILAVNDAFLEACSRRRQDLLGTSLFVAFPSNPDEPDMLPVRRYPIPLEGPDGTISFDERFWSACSAPVSGEDGAISARQAAEEKLRESVRRKDEFLATLAHELRNPIAPISAAAALLVAVTGYAQGSERQQIMSAGFDHYLVKPVDMERLAAILATV